MWPGLLLGLTAGPLTSAHVMRIRKTATSAAGVAPGVGVGVVEVQRVEGRAGEQGVAQGVVAVARLPAEVASVEHPPKGDPQIRTSQTPAGSTLTVEVTDLCSRIGLHPCIYTCMHTTAQGVEGGRAWIGAESTVH